MSVVVKNIGVMEKGAQNQRTTNLVKSFGDQGTVRLVLRNVEYVWGPNDSKTLPNDIGDEAVAADGRLAIVDNSEGADRTTLRV